MKYIKTFEIKKELTICEELINAAKRGSGSIKNILKNPKADVNCTLPGKGYTSPDQKTPLMHAVFGSYIMAVDTLLKAGANPNLVDFENRTALMMSSTMKIVDKLLEAGADVNIQSYHDKETAIMECVRYSVWTVDNMIILIEKFLEKGLDLDIKDHKGDNFYDLLNEAIEVEYFISENKVKWCEKLIMYMDDKFPKYKKEREIKKDMNKYNL